MPLGIERINVRRRSPNALVNFITPLEGTDKSIAQDYLERIAAIVYPIMKEHSLAIMNLDEFPPNLEFWGRNFNAGDCIQLVLKHPTTGQWLPFKFVQGVMIHELAHIKQMNHSSAFWSVRNTYSRALSALHARSYTGEGFWSAGRTLLSETYTQERLLALSEMPRHICGGTYRSRTRRRRQPPPSEKLSSAEQKKRRIERKFGVAGEGRKIGADVADSGGNSGPKPRVARSKRGRELRAAAAIKRFEEVKEKEKVEDETASESEDEKAVDVGGGKFMVPVSADEDGRRKSEDMDRELLELLGGRCCLGFDPDESESIKPPSLPKTRTIKPEPSSPPLPPAMPATPSLGISPTPPGAANTAANVQKPTSQAPAIPPPPPPLLTPTPSAAPQAALPITPQTCPICSFSNQSHAPVCSACMNVLAPSAESWACATATCPREYRNSRDVAFCGACGSRRP